MTRSFVMLGTIAWLAALPSAIAAQRPTYRITTADTLSWIDESSTQLGEANASGGRADSTGMKSRWHMRISLTPVRGDTVKVWFDSLAVSNEVDGERMELPTPTMYVEPFLLEVDRSGRIVRPRLSSKTAIPSRAGLAFFSGQFTDFFLPLPNEPLAVGVSWQDSASTADSASSIGGAVAKERETRISRYRVLRDTTVRGHSALVISATTETRTETSTVIPRSEHGGMTMTSVKTGSGFYVFDPAAGRLLGRRMSGEMRISGGPITEASTASAHTSVFRFSQRTDAVTR
jgi:hypothetical protein